MEAEWKKSIKVASDPMCHVVETPHVAQTRA